MERSGEVHAPRPTIFAVSTMLIRSALIFQVLGSHRSLVPQKGLRMDDLEPSLVNGMRNGSASRWGKHQPGVLTGVSD